MSKVCFQTKTYSLLFLQPRVTVFKIPHQYYTTWNIACSERWSFLYFSHSVMEDTKPLQSSQSDSLPSRVVQRYSFVAVNKQAPLRTVMVHTLLRVCSLQIYVHEKSFYRLNVDSTILKETSSSVRKTEELHPPFSSFFWTKQLNLSSLWIYEMYLTPSNSVANLSGKIIN